jgi:protein-tyrosine phosphatase
MSLMDTDRTIALEGAHNLRDFGGLPTTDGRVVRAGRLFRSDALGRLTERDLATMRSIGLRTVIDLRTTEELATRGRFPHERHPVTFHHLPVLDTTWDRDDPGLDLLEPDEFLFRAYAEMLDIGTERIARAFSVLAEPDALPAVFHCAVGKDRTGVLAALVLSALGVERDAVLADYDLTNAGLVRLRTWAAAHDPEVEMRMAAAPPKFLVADPRAVARLLDAVIEEHGSLAGYLAAIGVPTSDLDRLAEELLTDAQ